MEFNMLFSIGEMATLSNVTAKTLRFYDKIGLLEPAVINPENGYRFYSERSITRVLSIKQLQGIGMTLEDIQKFFQTNHETNVIDQLSKALDIQEQNVRAQMDNLQISLNKIKSLKKQCNVISDSFHDSDASRLIIREIGQRNIVFTEHRGKFDTSLFGQYFTQMFSSIQNDSSNIEEVISSAPLALYDSCSNTDKTNIKFGYEVPVTVELPFPTYSIKSGTYACYIHKGSYKNLDWKFIQELCLCVHNSGYETQFPLIEYFYINETSTDEENNYLTEIQFLINLQNIY